MAEYLFTGAFPRQMFGLSQAVNAWHHPASGDPSELADGQTVVLEPGDRVRIEGDYPHPELVEVIPAPVEDVEDAPVDPPAPTTKPARNGTKA